MDSENRSTSDESEVQSEEEESDLVEPESALPPIHLDQLPPALQEAVARAGWQELMPVQRKALPYMLAGRDLMVQSRTGSGKTGAFLLPILDRIDRGRDVSQALILVPTRELAQQVAKEAKMLAGDDVSSVAVYGGVGYGPQIEALQAGAQLVIGTPGRILDHLLRRNLRLDDLKVLIFDEADRMLSMGFYPDMREVQGYLPSRRIYVSMFSATFPVHVMRLAQEFLTDPDFLSLSRDRVHVADAEHITYFEPSMRKDRVLVRLIEIENPASAIVFCNTRKNVDYVTIVLQRFGYDADRLSSDLNQRERDAVLNRVRSGNLRFLVATDVAARGIDIPELSHVFQYEPPDDPEAYIHRAGRTARAGATGTAMSLANTRDERSQLERIAKRYGIEMEQRLPPSEEEVASIVSDRVTVMLEAKLRNRDKLKAERMRRFLPMINEWMEAEEGQELLGMLVDDFYQEALHARPEVPGEETRPKQSDQNRSSRSQRTRDRDASSSRSSEKSSGRRPARRRRRRNTSNE